MSHTDKGKIRALSRRGVRSDKTQPIETSTGRLGEPTLCDRCGASFERRTWRTNRRMSSAALALARWIVCPACKQVERGVGYGRVDIRGSFVSQQEADVRRRIASVTARDRARQPARRVISMDWDGSTFQVLTTSQKLAHRVARELEKAFGGRATYRWSDDRTLVASWTREASPAARRIP